MTLSLKNGFPFATINKKIVYVIDNEDEESDSEYDWQVC